mmetsp:Transcript_5040/g.8118  ORF Transcript_5040/g.8118 Transcript_5040/m.8118 type:complete len:88 (+) Transcript_5040:160-423(+)
MIINNTKCTYLSQQPQLHETTIPTALHLLASQKDNEEQALNLLYGGNVMEYRGTIRWEMVVIKEEQKEQQPSIVVQLDPHLVIEILP